MNRFFYDSISIFLLTTLKSLFNYRYINLRSIVDVKLIVFPYLGTPDDKWRIVLISIWMIEILHLRCGQ